MLFGCRFDLPYHCRERSCIKCLAAHLYPFSNRGHFPRVQIIWISSFFKSFLKRDRCYAFTIILLVWSRTLTSGFVRLFFSFRLFDFKLNFTIGWKHPVLFSFHFTPYILCVFPAIHPSNNEVTMKKKQHQQLQRLDKLFGEFSRPSLQLCFDEHKVGFIVIRGKRQFSHFNSFLHFFFFWDSVFCFFVFCFLVFCLLRLTKLELNLETMKWSQQFST